MNLVFFVNAIALGVGLAMDAFSVSLANGLNEPNMKKGRMSYIAGIFSFFQFAMPMIGWICVHTIVEYFNSFSTFIPWIALILLSYIGGKMIWEGTHPEGDEDVDKSVSHKQLLLQGVATSIDALSVGFTIANYGLLEAFVACLVIAIVTFGICYVGIAIGKKAGTKLAGKASIFGGVILIVIGLEIFISNLF